MKVLLFLFIAPLHAMDVARQVAKCEELMQAVKMNDKRTILQLYERGLVPAIKYRAASYAAALGNKEIIRFFFFYHVTPLIFKYIGEDNIDELRRYIRECPLSKEVYTNALSCAKMLRRTDMIALLDQVDDSTDSVDD